jgi:broad specificity phosphatase PhoE
MIFYCVRHGETEYNASGRIQGQHDSQLSERGRRQFKIVAETLAREPIEAVYSSPLNRAFEGAKLIAGALGLEAVVDPRLMEINAGIFQELTWDEIAVRYPQEAVRWRSGDADFQIPGGESRRTVTIRARAAFAEIREKGYQQVAIVAHGGLLSGALKGLLGIPAGLSPFRFDNGSITKLSWDQEVKLVSLNLTAHLNGTQGGGEEL